jgi:hypothetical protein
MVLKFRLSIALLIMSNFYCLPVYAFNVASLLKEIADDITIVKANGTCSANPFVNNPPCLAARAVCPTGKIPVKTKKFGQECTTGLKRFVEFDVNYSNVVTTPTKTATGYVECNPMSNQYYDQATDAYYPPSPGYTPLCNAKTKVCKTINYQVTARCITSPTIGVINKLGIKIN